MLLELKVRNFAIIDSIHISFQQGLNILSGETGAGKSVLLKSLALLMGEKGLSDTVRTGAQTATIEGFFDLATRPDIAGRLKNMGIDVLEDQLVVRRVISSQGKSRVYLNGSLSALNSLREVVSPMITVTGHNAPLIEMTGQHDNRHLQSKSYHMEVLDHYSGSWDLRQQFSDKFLQLKEIENEIQEIKEESRSRAQRLDFLIYQRDEINALGLKPGEEDELKQQLFRLKNSTRLVEFVQSAEQALYTDDDSALARLHKVVQKAAEIRQFDESLAKKVEPLTQAKTLIEEAIFDLRDYGDDLEADPAQLDSLEEKFSELRRLQKKYGGTVEEILATLAHIESEINGLETSDERLVGLERERELLGKELNKRADDLHKRRSQGALLLSKGVNDELAELNMKGVIFEVQVQPAEQMTSTGRSDVEFMIRSSKKDPLRPLAKFASGGELSRILLSLKRIIGNTDHPRTYLFDEVDAGVSGLTAEKVGKKLKTIAKGQQVICVTHLPQVASFADAHFLIEKSPSKKKGVHMEVLELKADDRVKEIARLISGEKISKTSMEHAKQLLSEA